MFEVIKQKNILYPRQKEEEKKHRPLFPTPGAPITASLTSDRVDFFRRTWSRIWYFDKSHASNYSKILSITKYSKIKTDFESKFGFHNITFIYLTYTADSTCGAHLLFENTSLSPIWQNSPHSSLFIFFTFFHCSLFLQTFLLHFSCLSKGFFPGIVAVLSQLAKLLLLYLYLLLL